MTLILNHLPSNVTVGEDTGRRPRIEADLVVPAGTVLRGTGVTFDGQFWGFLDIIDGPVHGDEARLDFPAKVGGEGNAVRVRCKFLCETYIIPFHPYHDDGVRYNLNMKDMPEMDFAKKWRGNDEQPI